MSSNPNNNNKNNNMCSNNPPHMSNGNGNIPSFQNPGFTNMANPPYQLPFQNFQMGMGLPQPQFFPNQMAMPFCPPQGRFFANNRPPRGQIFVNNRPPRGQFFANNRPPQGQFFANNRPPQGQFFANNRPRGPGGQFNFQQFPQHVNPMTGLPRGQFAQQYFGFAQVNPFSLTGCVNQGGQPQGCQNLGFHMNPQFGMVNSNQGQNMFIPAPRGQNASQVLPMTGQHLQRNSMPSINNGQAQMQHPQNKLQSDSPGKPQGNHAKDNESNNSNINQRKPQDNNFRKNQQGSAEGEPRNASPISRSRSLPLNYTDVEIQKWREERRKNHPSRSNIEKKTEGQTHSEVIDNDAQKRRQQLKEILAKQAELGVEVAEIPRDYLLDSENQPNRNEQNRNKNDKGRFKKRGGKRPRRGGANRFNKKQKLGDSDSSPRPALKKKDPTLLQKLLSADIKRDKSHLLQSFRFMVLNNFFVDWPEKSLEFPSVTVKDRGSGSEIRKKSSPQQVNGLISAIGEKDLVDKCVGPNELDTSHEDVAADNDAKNEEIICERVKETDCIGQENSDGEEGEITDNDT